MGNAVVFEKDGAPCFAISPKERLTEKGVFLRSVSVYDSSALPVKQVWAYATLSDKTIVISSKQCIKYGDTPGSSESRPAEKLLNGRVYEAVLKVHSKKQKGSTMGYLTKFCIISEPHEKVVIEQILPTTQNWKDNSCSKK
jgi:hypothetical protein